jgi:hypothetical protein
MSNLTGCPSKWLFNPLLALNQALAYPAGAGASTGIAGASAAFPKEVKSFISSSIKASILAGWSCCGWEKGH